MSELSGSGSTSSFSSTDHQEHESDESSGEPSEKAQQPPEPTLELRVDEERLPVEAQLSLSNSLEDPLTFEPFVCNFFMIKTSIQSNRKENSNSIIYIIKYRKIQYKPHVVILMTLVLLVIG